MKQLTEYLNIDDIGLNYTRMGLERNEEKKHQMVWSALAVYLSPFQCVLKCGRRHLTTHLT